MGKDTCVRSAVNRRFQPECCLDIPTMRSLMARTMALPQGPEGRAFRKAEAVSKKTVPP